MTTVQEQDTSISLPRLWDQFAQMALEGILHTRTGDAPNLVAKQAYDYADACIVERKNRKAP